MHRQMILKEKTKMKIKIPQNIDIFGHQYKIINRDEKISGVDSFGSHFGRVNRIYIDSKLRGSVRESCFIHELIEAVNWHLQLKLSHEQITGLENGLFQIFKKL